MALYDAKEKKKISESFHLDCNPSDIQHKWRDSKDERSLASLSRSAIFNITYPSSDIYLIIKVRSYVHPAVHPPIQPHSNTSFPNPSMKQPESGAWEWGQHQPHPCSQGKSSDIYVVNKLYNVPEQALHGTFPLDFDINLSLLWVYPFISDWENSSARWHQWCFWALLEGQRPRQEEPRKA